MYSPYHNGLPKSALFGMFGGHTPTLAELQAAQAGQPAPASVPPHQQAAYDEYAALMQQLKADSDAAYGPSEEESKSKKPKASKEESRKKEAFCQGFLETLALLGGDKK